LGAFYINKSSLNLAFTRSLIRVIVVCFHDDVLGCVVGAEGESDVRRKINGLRNNMQEPYY